MKKHVLKSIFCGLFAIFASFIVSVNSASAVPLTNPIVTHGQEYATFIIGDTDSVAWYTEYFLSSEELGIRAAFCVENQAVLANRAYELIARPANLETAALVAGNFYANKYGWSQTVTQIAIWEIVFDTDLTIADGNFQYLGSQSGDVAAILDMLDELQSYGPVAFAYSENSQDYLVAAPVPEPATMLLFGTGLIGIIGIGRKRLLGSN